MRPLCGSLSATLWLLWGSLEAPSKLTWASIGTLLRLHWASLEVSMCLTLDNQWVPSGHLCESIEAKLMQPWEFLGNITLTFSHILCGVLQLYTSGLIFVIRCSLCQTEINKISFQKHIIICIQSPELTRPFLCRSTAQMNRYEVLFLHAIEIWILWVLLWTSEKIICFLVKIRNIYIGLYWSVFPGKFHYLFTTY